MTELKDFDGKGTEQLETMYENWFLDYASYVILDRAVPYFEDGLKPVQRRILHSFWEKDDGRYNKIANIVGHTMQYHPHGDASIADAIVSLGQKELLIDTQGNWGNIMTGDRAAASRYIEGRLTPFAKEVLFNSETTNWVPSYDGRNNEPLSLPVKFPLSLCQGVEGIAVGLSTKILPHNFCELIQASIDHLRKRSFKLNPDFMTGGAIDVSNYNEGKRGGKVKVRAKIEKKDNKTLVITEIPATTTTSSLMDSIVNANSKSKIKIKRIEDNTAKNVEIVITLGTGVDPQVTIDALYAFTDCEVSISPNCCIIVDRHPVFIGVKDLLRRSTDNTLELLKWELTNRIEALEKKWHSTSLEKIFIEKRVYLEIEEAKDRENMIDRVTKGLKPYTKILRQKITEEDVLRLCEIPIRRISRFDVKKTNDLLAELDEKVAKTKHNLEHLVEYTVSYFKHLLKKYSAGRERKTRIEEFSTISVAHVAVANHKYYVSRKDGFVGTSLKKEEFAFEVSDYDEIAIFKKDGSFCVVKVEPKTFVGKNILMVEKFVKGDKHRIYNMMYQDGKEGKSLAKRFNIGGITRNRQYDLTKGSKHSKILFLTSNPNGEAGKVAITLKPQPRIKLNFNFNFADVAIKGRSSQGNTVSKHQVRSVKEISKGSSTTGPREMYFDPSSCMVQSQSRGYKIGDFESEDKVIVVRRNGKAQLLDLEENLLIGTGGGGAVFVGKHDSEKIYSMVYYDGEKFAYYIKRFNMDGIPVKNEFTLIGDNKKSAMLLFSDVKDPNCLMEYQVAKKRSFSREVINLADESDVRSYKALGSRLTAKKMIKIAIAPNDVVDGEKSVEEALKKENPIELDLFG